MMWFVYNMPNIAFAVRAIVRARVESSRLFRYQHVGIGNAKWLHPGSKPMQGPNANRFAF